jgi:hypothetical protein
VVVGVGVFVMTVGDGGCGIRGRIRRKNEAYRGRRCAVPLIAVVPEHARHSPFFPEKLQLYHVRLKVAGAHFVKTIAGMPCVHAATGTTVDAVGFAK